MSLFEAKTAGLPNGEPRASVILRRQVPIRFDEEPRSWLGGLPRLPNGMEWPRATPRKPLHFVAQIDCAGLPKELWDGLGPREGWLLLFVDFEAIDDQKNRPIARVLHVNELGAEAEPPSGLYFARRSVTDLSRLRKLRDGAQRRHFRRWPIDLIPAAANTSQVTGAELYGAPEDDLSLGAPQSIAIDRPITWRGAYSIVAGLVLRYAIDDYERNWAGNSGGLLDYPEPDASGFNKDWIERRQRLPEWGQHPGFYEADGRLKARMREERRAGWTRRALKVLGEETTRSLAFLEDYRARVAAAQDQGDHAKAGELHQSLDYFEIQVAARWDHRDHLESLFARYSEESLTDEIHRAGCAHLEWAQLTQDRLRELLTEVARRDLDAPIASSEWDAIVAEMETMKSTYWRATWDTDVLRKVETGIYYRPLLEETVREEMLDCYTSPPRSGEGLDTNVVADLEPRLRHLECGRPHKLGGLIDSVYGDLLQDDELLLFQLASDAATGWIFGDLGMIYISIDRSDLMTGSFDRVATWLEA